MKCDIIIPIWNQKNITKDCIDSIVRNAKYPYRLILIDNASDGDTKSYLESVRDDRSLEVKLIRNEENLGFVKAVNQALKISNAPYVCIFNNDTVTTPGWLNELIEFAETHKDIGIMNPLYGRPAGVSMDEYAALIARDNKGKYMETNQCFFSCALIKREVIEKVGYLDEVFGIGSFDDADYAMRAGLAGYRCACVHSAYVHHIDGVSFNAMGNRRLIIERCEKEFLKKWPRHLRMGMAFSLSGDTEEKAIADVLKGALFLAREWCWINLWIFGDTDSNRKRIESVSAKIGMPSHQNIKFNYFPWRLRHLQTAVRLIERSFGTKKRKKYDAVFVDSIGMERFLNFFSWLHKNTISKIDGERGFEKSMRLKLSEMRSDKRCFRNAAT